MKLVNACGQFLELIGEGACTRDRLQRGRDPWRCTGMNIFTASARFGRPAPPIVRARLPFYALLLLCVLIITYVPALSLWLAR